MPDEKIVNLGGTIEGFPKTPIVGGPSLNGGPSTGQPLSSSSINNLFLNAYDVAGKTRQPASDIPFSSFYSGGRYDETRPFTDFEEMAAQQQSSWSKWKNGIAKMAGNAVTSFVSGTAGLVYGIGSAIANGKFSDLYNNDVTRKMDDVMKDFEDYAPNYYTHEEKDAGWLSTKNILTANFWSDKVLKNLGYSFGSIGGGVAWATLFKSIGLTNALVRAGKGMETATAVENGMAAVGKTQKFAAFQNALTSLSQKYLKQPVATVLTDADRVLTSVMGTVGEASMEGLQNMNSFRDAAIRDYKDKYGYEPTGNDLDEINRYAEGVGTSTWAMNTLFLSATNYIQLPKILNSSRKIEKAVMNDIEQAGVGKAFEEVVPKTRLGRIARIPGRVAALAFSPSEAFEEGAQYAIQTGTDNFFKRAYENKDDLNGFFSTIGGVMGNVFSEGVTKALTDKEGLESILIGGLSGGLQQIRGEIKEGGISGRGGEKKVNTQTALAALNKTNIDEALKTNAKFVAIGIGSQKLRQEAIAANDILSEKDFEKDFALSYVMPRVRYGKADAVYNELGYYESQAMSDTGFQELKTSGIVNEKEDRPQFLQRINGLKETTKSVEKLYSVINDKYSDVYDSDGKRVYSPDVMDKMVYAASKIQDYDNRLPQLAAKLISTGIDTATVLDEVLNTGELSEKAKEESLAKIDALKSVDEDGLKTDFADLVRMAGHRKQFLDEYNDIKINPEKYKEKEIKPSAPKEGEVAANKIRVISKDGDIDLEIGKEYYAGAPMRKGKEGVRFQEFSRFTVIGKTEDGKIILQPLGEDTEPYTVDADYFKKHQIDTVESAQKKPNAKFYADSAHLVFSYKLGGGKTVDGTIRYNRKTDKLEFVSLDGKRFTITRSDFKAKKGFTEAKIVAVGELTARAKEALDAPMTQEELMAQYDAKDAVLAELVDSTKQKIEEANKKIEAAKKKLASLKEAIDNLSKTKEGLPRVKFTKAIRKTISELSKQREEAESEIADNELEKEQLTAELSYFQELYDNQDRLPEGYKPIIKELKNDIAGLKEMIDHVDRAIVDGSSLLDSINSALTTALNLFNDFVQKIKSQNPNLPLAVEELQTRLEKYLGEEGAKQYIAEKLGFTEAVMDLEEQLSLYGEELKVPDLTKKVEQLSTQLTELLDGFGKLSNEKRAKSKILEAFQKAADEYKRRMDEENSLVKDRTLISKVLKTQDGGPQTVIYSEDYEPDYKKDNISIVQGTTVPTVKFSGGPIAQHHVRANTFGFNLENFENRDNVRGVIVTSKNENEVGLTGLTQFLKDEGDPTIEVEPTETIALVMVEIDPVDGTKHLIGVDGKRLAPTLSAKEALNQAIYQVFPKDLTWSNGDSMFREKTPDNVKESLEKQYEDWRKETLKNPNQTAHKINASFGIPEYNTRLDEEGAKHEEVDTNNSVQSAGLIKNDDLLNDRFVEVPTTETSLENGSRWKNPLGKPFLILKNAYVKLKNRKLTSQEAATVYQAIERLVINAYEHEDGIDSEEAQTMIKYLKSIVYWGVPRNELTNGQNSIFFNKTDGLGGLKLFIHGEEQNIPFTPSGIKRNKDFIIAQLENTYNNISSKMTDTNWAEPFEEVISISEDGKIETRSWPNYQSYLLSSNLPDSDGTLNGKLRDASEIPLTTSIRAKKDESDVNRNGIYFTVDYGEEKFHIPTAEKKKRAFVKKKKGEDIEEEEVDDEEVPKGKGVKMAPKGTYILDGKTVNTFETSKGEKILFFANSTDLAKKNIKDGIKIIFLDGDGNPVADAKKVQDRLIKSGFSKEESVAQIKGNIYKAIEPTLKKSGKKAGKQGGKKIDIDEEFVIEDEEEEEIEEETEEIIGSSIFKKTKKDISEEEDVIEDDDDEIEIDEEDAAFPDEEFEITDDDEEELKDDLDNLPEDAPFRLQVEENIKRYDDESWKKEEEWLKQNFPLIPAYRFKNILRATNGLQVFGLFQKGAIYLWKNAEVGTAYHEVFHAVWRMFTTREEREKMRKEFKSREGEFFDRPSLSLIKYSEATNKQIEEALAEEARDYFQEGIAPKKSKEGGNFILKALSDLFNWIKEMIVGKKATSNIEKLFERMGSGYYKTMSPYDAKLSLAKDGIIDIEDAFISDDAVFSVANFTDQQTHDIMQQMTYFTLGKLIDNNESLFSLPTINKDKLYKDLRIQVRRTVTKLMKAAQDNVRLGKVKEKDALPDIQKSMMMRQLIKNNSVWEALVAKHEEYLRKYNIEFDENDDVILKDENNSGREIYWNATEIDTFRKANSAIKLLLSTLPMVEEYTVVKDGVEIKKTKTTPSSIGGVTLLPTIEVWMKIMNKVHNSMNIEDMLDRIRQMGVEDVNYRSLYTRLTRREFTTEKVDFSNLKESHDLDLINAVWKSFKKQNPDVKNHYILDDGKVQIGDANLATAARVIKSDMLNNVIKVIKGKNPYFKEDKNRGAYIANPNVVKNFSITNNADRVKFLKSLGITFKLSDLNKLSKDKITTFKKAVAGIRTSLIKADVIYSITSKVLDLDGQLMKLAEIKATIENPEVDSTFIGGSGQKKQSFVGTNAASDLYDALSQVNNLNDIPKYYPQYSYLLTDSFVQGSVILSKMFNLKTGERKPIDENIMKPEIVDSTVDISKGRTKESAKLTYKERFIQEINLNLSGHYLNLVPGDASMEWMTKMGVFFSADSLKYGLKNVNAVMKGYLLSEIELARETNRPIVGKRNRKDLRFFKDILGETLHNKIISDKRSPEEIYTDNEKDINAAIEDFIKKQSDKTKFTLSRYGVARKENNLWYVENIDFEETDGITDGTFNRELNALTINYMIANIEFHKLLYSDPYQYSDELKRIKNFLSPRQALMANSKKMNAAMNNVHNKEYSNSNDIARTDFNRDYFRTVTLADIWGIHELPGYNEIPYEEANGSGIISLKSHRSFRIRSGDWTPDNELQYMYDMAWEKDFKGRELSDEEKRRLGLTLSQKEQEILDAGNPYVKSTYTPSKPIVSGNKNDGKDYNDIILDKFALYPLSFRVMMELSEEGNPINAVKLYDKMQKEGIDYVVFESGRKVGGGIANDVYNKNGDFNNDPFKGIINVPFSIMSVQAEVPSKEDNLVSRGSQMTKLVTMDFMEAGVPIDFDETEKDFNQRFIKWISLSTEEERMTNSSIYREIKNNENLLISLIEDGYQNLIKRLGIKEVEKETIKRGKSTFEKAYEIVDIQKVTNTLTEEVLKREVNDNIISALKGFENGQVILEATPAYQQIRNILYSIADKEVISQKLPGGMKVQIPSAFMETQRIESKVVNGKNAFVSDSLKFYKNDDGERICELMIGRWFDSDMSDEQLLKYLNETEEGKRILSGVAFRIPTQKQNSIDRFVIKKFLPREFGDSVVIPGALVQKAGSDFDIDKLSIYLKNLIINKFGEPKLIEYLTDENSTAKQRYFHWVISNSNLDTRKYVKFLSRGVVGEIRGRFANAFAQIKGKYPSSVREEKEIAYGHLLNLYKTELPNKLTAQDEYLQELFDKGRDVFFSLSDDTREDYWQLKSEMFKQGVNGPEEIRRYLSLTLGKLENPFVNEEDVSHLQNMVILYEEELKVLGITEAFITEYKKLAVESYRKYKNALLGALKLKTSNELQNLEDKYRSEKEEFDFEFAKEVASIDDLLPYEEFEKLSTYKQNVKKALENAYIESCERLISHPKNFSKLIKPNSAEDLKKLAKIIVDKLKLPKFDYSSVGNMLDRTYMSTLRHSFVSGKYCIGIAAVNQTNHSLNQRAPIYIDLNKLDETHVDKKWLRDGKLKFFKKDGTPNFNTITINNEIVTTLSMIRNAVGQDISDIISQFIDGYVDISKGPWIMQLGATQNVAGTFLFLVKTGVPIDTVVYFMNQPIIRDYLRMLENKGTSYLFNLSRVNEIKSLNEYDANPKDIAAVKQIPLDLEKTLGKEDLTPIEKAEQQFILNEFLKYAKLAEHMFHVTQGSNFDTANFNDPYLVFKKEQQLIKAQKTIISSVDDLLTNSFLQTLRLTVGRLRNALSSILSSDKSRVRSIIQKVILPYTNLSDRDFVKLAQKAVADLFDWAVQTDSDAKDGIRLNAYIQNALLDDDNYVREISEFIDEVKANPKHPLYNNEIIKIVQPILSDKMNGVDNLKIRGRDNKVYDQNRIIYAFKEMKEYLSGRKAHLYDKLVTVAVLQSGLSSSPISFTSLLPYEDFKKIYNKTLSKLETIPNLENFYKMNIFERNNWNNDDIIPYKKAEYIESSSTGDKYYNINMNFLPGDIQRAVVKNQIPPVLSISMYSREGMSDFIVYSWEDESIDYAERRAMAKKGDYSYIKKGLFKKVKDSSGDPLIYTSESNNRVYENYIYQAINAWGDSFRANEFYNIPKKSKIENGFIKVKEVSPEEIINVFVNKPVKKAPEKSVMKPKGRPAIKNRNKNNCG